MRLVRYLTILIAISTFLFISCSTVPITGRRQLSLIPESQMLSMSFSQYDQFLKENKESNDPQKVATVKRVGEKIASAVETYLRNHGMADEVKNYKWEFHLIESNEVNAWCMPGGKVVVYTGIFPIAKDDNGLAVVLGHEISHAVAKHGDERMSQALVAQLGGIALQEALKNKPQETQQIFLAAYGVGAQVGVLLPFSRTQESEADHLGLIFMAMAGYDPHGAITFWERMMNLNTGSKPPEFLSDHPADQTRINDIKAEIPEAMKYYSQR